MIAILLVLLVSFPFAQTMYNGLLVYKGQTINCSRTLNKYAHKGVPSIKEDEKVKLCCKGVREVARREGVNALLVTHLRICRQLGR